MTTVRAILVVLPALLWGGTGQRVTLSLAGSSPTEVSSRFTNLTAGTSEIWVTDVPSTAGFFIIQVHAFPHNVTLSSSRKFKPKYTGKGPDVGLVSFEKPEAVFYLRLETWTQLLIAATIYGPQDPVPGGCNLSLDPEIVPFQLVSYTENLITVISQPPSAPNNTCDHNDVQVDMYHLYLHEYSYEDGLYHSGILNMMTPDLIKSHGYKVSTVDGHFKYSKLYSAYRGVGQIFAIVATYQGGSTAYVPAVTYACDVINAGESCNGPVTPYWKFICAALLIFGLYLNFLGHRFFRFTLWLMGFFLGVFVTYAILSTFDSLSVGAKTTISLSVAVFYGLLSLFLWSRLGIPIISAGVTFFISGFLMASIIFYSGIVDFFVFRSESTFWLTFAGVIVFFQTLWMVRTLEGHVFGCSLVGAYAMVAALCYYIGGNLQYILINTFRRMVVKDFNMATVDPPVQVLDVVMSVVLVGLTTWGFYFQMKVNGGRPPFPPHRVLLIEADETTPLIY